MPVDPQAAFIDSKVTRRPTLPSPWGTWNSRWMTLRATDGRGGIRTSQIPCTQIAFT